MRRSGPWWSPSAPPRNLQREHGPDHRRDQEPAGDLIERIDTSDRRTKEVFDQHEAKDQERFHKIDQVQGTLVAGQESMKGAVGVIEDRAVQLAEKRAKWLTWQQGLS